MEPRKPTPDEIFEAALQLTDPVKRAAYLNKALGNNDQLRQRVEALLKAHEAAGDFLYESPAGVSAKTLLVSKVAEMRGAGMFDPTGVPGPLKWIGILTEVSTAWPSFMAGRMRNWLEMATAAAPNPRSFGLSLIGLHSRRTPWVLTRQLIVLIQRSCARPPCISILPVCESYVQDRGIAGFISILPSLCCISEAEFRHRSSGAPARFRKTARDDRYIKLVTRINLPS